MLSLIEPSNAVEYSTLSLTYLLLVGIAAQAIGIYAFWYIQQRFHLSVKTMFSVIAVGIVLLDGWGMIGIWQQNFGKSRSHPESVLVLNHYVKDSTTCGSFGSTRSGTASLSVHGIRTVRS